MLCGPWISVKWPLRYEMLWRVDDWELSLLYADIKTDGHFHEVGLPAWVGLMKVCLHVCDILHECA